MYREKIQPTNEKTAGPFLPAVWNAEITPYGPTEIVRVGLAPEVIERVGAILSGWGIAPGESMSQSRTPGFSASASSAASRA